MTTTDQFTSLIRDIVAAFVHEPDKLRIAAQPAADGACYFVLQGCHEDESRIVGAHGSHVDAMALLVEALGKSEGRRFTFRAITPGPRILRQKEPRRDVLQHDPASARELLNRILEGMDLAEFAVDVGPGTGPRDALTFAFTIRVRDAVDYHTLTVPAPGKYPNETLIAAIGTLYRAIAKKAGVRYIVSVAQT